MSARAWHEKQMRQAIVDKLAAEKRQQGSVLMHEAAALVGDEVAMKYYSDEVTRYSRVAIAASARVQDQTRRALLAEE